MAKKMWRRMMALVLSAAVSGSAMIPCPVMAAENIPVEESAYVEVESETAEAVAEDIPEIAVQAQSSTPSRVKVHDPSLIKGKDGTYYVFGTHMADATSKDLINWTQLYGDFESWQDNGIYGNVVENFAEAFRWAGYKDGFAGDVPDIWAPHVIWNPYYENEDGTKGAYMLYCSMSSSYWRSCICYAVSKDIDGPYQYVDTVMYSGFTTSGAYDGSTRSTKWDNDYLNLKELTQLGAANGGIDGISNKWFDGNGGANHNYMPNAIDATIFFDTEGNMYMIYGSWSGGIYMLPMDPATGAAIYPGVDGTDPVSGNYVDRYFGIHIAGGNALSGEGPYIFYDEETQYYYLYETYGGLEANGGYNMRLFRSKNPTGPYLDAAGRNAADSGRDNDNYGIKLIGNYQFYNQDYYKAAGHNSVFTDDDGQRYLAYHQRFGTAVAGRDHEIRIHQQFMNQDDWPVAAVYEYRGDKITHYTDDEVVGAYEFINHGSATTPDKQETADIVLQKDGSVTGAVTGTWKKVAGADYDYAVLTLDGVEYRGVFFRQTNEMTKGEETMTFTAVGNNNQSVWGSSLEVSDEIYVNRVVTKLESVIPKASGESFALPSKIEDADVTWSSDRADIMDSRGNVQVPAENTKVTLTATIHYQTATKKAHFSVLVYGRPKLIYGFNFDGTITDGSVTADADSTKKGSAVLKGSASVVEDSERGKVLELKNTAGAKDANYLELPADTFKDMTAAGFSVSMWVNLGSDVWEHSALFEADMGVGGQYPMTRIGANLIARINANAFSDVTDTMLAGSGSRNVWQHVVYTINQNGIRVYLNGALVGEEKKDLKSCFNNSSGSIQKVTHIAVGSGFIWNDEDIRDARFDEVKVYSGALSAFDVKRMYSPISAEKITVAAPAAQTYTGKALTPALSVTCDGISLLKDIDYTTEWKNNVNVGTAEVTLTFKNGYVGSVTREFAIQKAPSVIQATKTYKKTMDKKGFTLDAVLKNGAGTLQYKSNNLTVAAVNAKGYVTMKKAGKAVITVSVPGNANYEPASVKITVTVTEAKPAKVKIKNLKVIGTKKMQVTYQKVKKASGYVVEYSTLKNFKKAAKVTVKSGAKTKAVLKKLKPGKKYFVRVRAYKKTASGKIYGVYSKVLKKKMPRK